MTGILAQFAPEYAPYTLFMDGNGNPAPVYNRYRQAYIDTAGGGMLLDWRYYPLDDYRHTIDRTSVLDLNAVIGLNYKINKSLKLDVRYKYEKQGTGNRLIHGLGSFYTRDLVNNYAQPDYSAGSVRNIVPKGDIIDVSDNTLDAQEVRGQVSFDKAWRGAGLSIIAGGQVSGLVNQGGRHRTYGLNQETLTSVDVDYVNTYPLLAYGYDDYIPSGNDFSKTSTRFVSVYFNGALTLRNRYTFSLSGRRDASNTFGLKTNDKWEPLWSAGAGWLLSGEDFYKFGLISTVRLKATYGYSGNVDPSRVALTTFIYTATNPYTQTPYGQVQNFANPELRWEQVSMFDLGLELRGKGGRVSGSVEFYRKRMKDLYGTVPVDVTVGLGRNQVTKNVGTMEGRGWDIEVNTLNIDGQLKWSTDFILNLWKDRLSKENLPGMQAGSVAGSEQTALKGYSPYSYFAYRWAGLDPATGDPEGYFNGGVSKDYTLLTGSTAKVSELVYIGPRLPQVFGSIGNTVSFRGMSVTARITYKFRYFFSRQSVDYGSLFNLSDGHADFGKRWQKPGDEAVTDIPSMVYPEVAGRDEFYRNSEVLATKGDHVRLQYLNVAYDLGTAKYPGLKLNNLQVYAAINNIGIIWRANKYGIDPDFSERSPPPPTSFSLGVRAGF